MSETLLRVENLQQHFRVSRTYTVRAVNGVSFDIHPGETYGLVGESGSGKTTIGRSIIRLYNPTGGKITFNGRDITGRLDNDTRSMLRKEMQMIFQDPMASLNPRKKVEDIIGEGLDIHRRYSSRQDRSDQIIEMLKKVGLSPEHAARYPHQFSGGQRQRVSIARALALNPKLIICDEPVSALDVSIQSQILNLLGGRQQELGLTYVFISHDLSVVRYLSDRVCVMFLGKVCELGVTRDIYANPLHPYTKFLLEAVPIPDPKYRKDQKDMLTGEIPSPVNPPSGCHFRTRCPYATERCAKEVPQLHEVEPGRTVACHLFDK